MAGMEGQDVNTEGNSMRFEFRVPKRFSYDELSVATGLFSNESKLGQGGSGSVYRGRLQSGTLVAVKRIYSSVQSQGRKEFEHEVAILIELRHRNLIELRGWCEDRDRSELLLVYELAPNGSVDDALFKAGLSWPQRLSILTGTAAALGYLHQGWKRQVLHRDVKCSNIMLDEDWNAQLGDFGISRMVDHECDAATTTMVGTFGYMAPELFAVGRFTDKSDVYAFGVVILEVLCGRRVLPKRGSHELALVPFVRDVSKKRGDLLSVVDKQLTGYDKQQMVAVLEVGLKCTSENPNDRPSMRKVVHMLEMDPFSSPVVTKTKHSWLGWFRSRSNKREWNSSPRGSENVASSSSENVASSSSVWVKHDPIPHPTPYKIGERVSSQTLQMATDYSSPRGAESVASSSSVWVKHDPIPYRAPYEISSETLKMATDGFNSDRRIAYGSSGSVYYGQLENKDVAVKCCDRHWFRKEELVNIVDVLKRAHHFNLVSLVAYCDERDHFALVSEYAANGNLRQWIYNPEMFKGVNKVYNGRLKEFRGTLDWSKRLQIALDAAQGLEYLHKKCYPGVLHCNVSSSNILLDQSMVAKVAGLTHLHPITNNDKDRIVLRQAFLYRDPDLTSRETFKADVYSFGVVLAEIITGLPPYLYIDNVTLLDFEKIVTTNDMLKLVDAKLRGEYNMKSMLKMAELVLLCVKPIGLDRPDIDEVVRSIKKALELEKA